MKRLDLLKCVSNVSWGADRPVMLHLYRAIVRAKLDYGSFVYMSPKDTALKVLDPVHHAAIRLSVGAFRLCHRSFVIFTDSKSVTQKLQHYNTTHPPAYKIIRKLLHLRNRNKFVVVCWCPSHVGIKGIEAADRAARAKPLSNDPCNEFYKDYFPIIRRRTRDLWA